MGGCKHNSKLITSRHNNTFKLLHDLLERNSRRRWSIINMDLGRQPTKDFKIETQANRCNHAARRPIPACPRDHTRRNSKWQINNTTTHNNPNPIPTKTQTITTPQTKAHNKSHRIYSTDNNILDTINNIHTIHEPLKHAILLQNKGRLQVQIIPIVISMTCNFQTRPIAKIAQLISFKENPPDSLTYKTIPKQSQTIIMVYTNTYKNGYKH